MPTPNYGWNTPPLPAPNNVPADMLSLATQVDATLAGQVKIEVVGASIESAQWDRIAAYGTTATRCGRLVTLTFGLQQKVAAPTADATVLRINAAWAPPVNVGIPCATSAGTIGMMYVTPTGDVKFGAAYGPAKPLGTNWLGAISWVRP